MADEISQSSGNVEETVLTSIQKAQLLSKDPNYDKHWRVNALPPEVFERVFEMLKRHSPRTVAELLQEEGYHKDIKAITLTHILERFRKEKIPAHQLLNPYIVERITGELKRNVNVFNELGDLIALQRERIRKAVLEEEESGELLPETNKQLHLQSRMLKILGDLGVKSGLMSEFFKSFMSEVELAEESMTIETRTMFLRYFLYKMQGGTLDETLEELTTMPVDTLSEGYDPE